MNDIIQTLDLSLCYLSSYNKFLIVTTSTKLYNAITEHGRHRFSKHHNATASANVIG